VGEALGDYFLLPGVNLETVEIQKPLQLDVHAQLPDSPGFYQLDLFVSPRQGRLIRYPGPIVEVKP
jgi:hypothetical protein